jgi:hypothetical protein
MAASYVYPSLEADFDAGLVDFESGLLRVILVDPTYEPRADHSRLADVRPFEVSGPGYKAGGRPLSNVQVGADAITADNVLWPLCSVEARGCVVYQDGGGGPLVAYLDFGQVEESQVGRFEIRWPKSVVLSLI